MDNDIVQQIKDAVKNKWSQAHKLDIDVTWDGCCQDLACVINIIDDSFEGVKLLQRHRMVKEVLEPYNHKIHKTELKTNTLAEAQKKGLI